MENVAISIRPFVGAKDYEMSRSFYGALGFQESPISTDMSLFRIGKMGFYLQRAYVKDWIDNSMIFLEVEDLDLYWKELVALELTTKFPDVRLSPIQKFEWGRECFMHDPSGILWHIGQFNGR
jgi:hypothetical protein